MWAIQEHICVDYTLDWTFHLKVFSSNGFIIRSVVGHLYLQPLMMTFIVYTDERLFNLSSGPITLLSHLFLHVLVWLIFCICQSEAVENKQRDKPERSVRDVQLEHKRYEPLFLYNSWISDFAVHKAHFVKKNNQWNRGVRLSGNKDIFS